MAHKTDSNGTATLREDLEAVWQRGFDWVEQALSARIVSFERQPRWRPAFFVEAERCDRHAASRQTRLTDRKYKRGFGVLPE